MKIISASRRTDIPAFYSEWLMNRLSEGYVRVPNPFNPHQISTVILTPEEVACLVFMTKDPRPILPRLDELDRRGYRYYFQVTVTGLPRALEPGVPEPDAVVAAMRELSHRLGSGRVIWRFDPILLTKTTTPEGIIRSFGRLAASLAGSVNTVIVSFAREYPTVRKRLAQAALLDDVRFVEADSPEKLWLAAALAETAARHGMTVQSCADPADLSPFGIAPGSCVDATLINRLFGLQLKPDKDRGQRKACRCARSVDLGIYGTCPHRCIYCYASCDVVLQRGKQHSPAAASLITHVDRP